MEYQLASPGNRRGMVFIASFFMAVPVYEMQFKISISKPQRPCCRHEAVGPDAGLCAKQNRIFDFAEIRMDLNESKSDRKLILT